MGVAELLLAGDRHSTEYYRAAAAADAADTAAVLALAGGEDAALRAAVALTLPLLSPGGSPASELIEAAIVLSADPDPRVRDHACLALGQQWSEVDTSAVREPWRRDWLNRCVDAHGGPGVAAQTQ